MNYSGLYGPPFRSRDDFLALSLLHRSEHHISCQDPFPNAASHQPEQTSCHSGPVMLHTNKFNKVVISISILALANCQTHSNDSKTMTSLELKNAVVK